MTRGQESLIIEEGVLGKNTKLFKIAILLPNKSLFEGILRRGNGSWAVYGKANKSRENSVI